MRTKALILTAAVSMVGIAGMAAEVTSANVVGFVNKPLHQGFNLIANPLKATNDTIGAFLPAPADGTMLYTWDTAHQTWNSPLSFDSVNLGGWEDPSVTVAPGVAFFLYSPVTTNVTFVGEVRQGDLSTPLVAGYSFVGSQVAQSGAITSVLGLTPSDGDVAITFNATSQTYDNPLTYDFLNLGGWEAEPNLGMADGVVLLRSAAGNWTRTFNVQ